jgi:hypothetical protein
MLSFRSVFYWVIPDTDQMNCDIGVSVIHGTYTTVARSIVSFLATTRDILSSSCVSKFQSLLLIID